MGIFTAERRAVLWGEGQKRQEWGLNLVEVVMPDGHPCPKCAAWRGMVLVDDVYSGGWPDGKHKLLSEAMAAGFLHPRCRDSVETFFPWEEEHPDPIRGKELEEAEAAEAEEARQQNAERMAERWDRRAQYSLDPGEKRAAEARAAEWREEAEQWQNSEEARPFVERAREIMQRARAEYGEGMVALYGQPVHESRVVEVMRKEYSTWISGLSKKERHAIRKYTRNSLEEPEGKFYRRLNAMLRGDLPEDPLLREYAEIISAALKRQPLQESIVCYRNVNVNPFEGKTIGEVVEGRQFYSTSVIPSRTMPGQYHLTIIAPEGTLGAYVGEISRVKSQREFLIDKDCRYRLISIQGTEIVMEVIV